MNQRNRPKNKNPVKVEPNTQKHQQKPQKPKAPIKEKKLFMLHAESFLSVALIYFIRLAMCYFLYTIGEAHPDEY